MDTALVSLGKYTKLKKGTRIVLVEDMLLARVTEWLLDNWKNAMENSAELSDELFAWIIRKHKKPYTISTLKDWPRIEKRFNRIIKKQHESKK